MSARLATYREVGLGRDAIYPPNCTSCAKQMGAVILMRRPSSFTTFSRDATCALCVSAGVGVGPGSKRSRSSFSSTPMVGCAALLRSNQRTDSGVHALGATIAPLLAARSRWHDPPRGSVTAPPGRDLGNVPRVGGDLRGAGK